MAGTKEVNPLPELACACATIRRTARLVTQLYSHEMTPLEPGQFALLTAFESHPGVSQALLGRALGLDKTTLSRNLRLLERNNWIMAGPTSDQRERGYRLTHAGKKVLASTRTGWTHAQRKLRGALKPGEWETMMDVFGRVAGAVLAAQQEVPTKRKGRNT
jgi:DNA-binding MarR family transcriptional regulator